MVDTVPLGQTVQVMLSAALQSTGAAITATSAPAGALMARAVSAGVVSLLTRTVGPSIDDSLTARCVIELTLPNNFPTGGVGHLQLVVNDEITGFVDSYPGSEGFTQIEFIGLQPFASTESVFVSKTTDFSGETFQADYEGPTATGTNTLDFYFTGNPGNDIELTGGNSIVIGIQIRRYVGDGDAIEGTVTSYIQGASITY
jgi:hypothetical protein